MRQVNFGKVEAILIWKPLTEVTVEAIGIGQLSGARIQKETFTIVSRGGRLRRSQQECQNSKMDRVLIRYLLILRSRNPLKPVEIRDIYYLEAFMSLKDHKVQTGTTRDGDFETSE